MSTMLDVAGLVAAIVAGFLVSAHAGLVVFAFACFALSFRMSRGDR